MLPGEARRIRGRLVWSAGTTSAADGGGGGGVGWAVGGEKVERKWGCKQWGKAVTEARGEKLRRLSVITLYGLDPGQGEAG